ncbi:MAG: 50S ribosomal protein L3 [Candidatus Magasanikbacteria bacterium GW2011_GWC2_40_17]|uniref:50S ribosomal protein L3 n=1 Tax=Candidatus Magasanikbacteria bacterium GW2011_GWA2_42_32 TaxID=1619039 RepID=A0A0G1A772_9BACT|nr:MAG: 50S ribosomal protein L3 [Candidatus Magasanikbacteria bacterium GW2011_GWC2_40_17]KKS56804.1 MAG: 50S ribosomal protein L3 [Candidatus Magasanikbacteria bacterium GW2011_GWA2_42_32]OGH86011.1 MAG: 50S ribosomal protein L3 [Candidatus Magasanikbacteria bacterium RIFOXYB2_FULL_38_10]
MSQIYKENGDAVPVTIVQAGPCFVTGIKENKENGKKSVQIGFKKINDKKLSKPEAGHLKGLPAVRFLKEIIDGENLELKRGDEYTVENFKAGEKIEATGISKGKGFQGVVKRHHFAGGPATHGHKDNLRMPGSIGSGGVQRVFKGLRMAGRMGGEQITVKNLEVVEVDAVNNLLKLKGALPGGRNSLLLIKAPGKIAVLKKENLPVEPAPIAEAVAVKETVTQESTQE